jgi:probable F420-dependent oxidoreductase
LTTVFVASGFIPEEDALALAPEVQRLGYDGMTLPDHLFMPETKPGEYPYSADGHPPFALDAPWPDDIVLIAALSQIAPKLRFMTAVLVLPLRHPIVLGKALGTVARISGGRVILGVGVGWQREEFDALGIDFTTRGARANEMIQAMRTLWQKGPVEHHGRFFDFGPLLMEPVPPRTPIFVGGKSDAALRRAARLGDGYAMPTMPFDEVPGTLERLRRNLADAGRDESAFEIYAPCGSADAGQIEEIIGYGVDYISVMPWPNPGKEATTIEQKLEALERHATDVLPAIRGVAVR